LRGKVPEGRKGAKVTSISNKIMFKNRDSAPLRASPSSPVNEGSQVFLFYYRVMMFRTAVAS